MKLTALSFFLFLSSCGADAVGTVTSTPDAESITDAADVADAGSPDAQFADATSVDASVDAATVDAGCEHEDDSCDAGHHHGHSCDE